MPGKLRPGKTETMAAKLKLEMAFWIPEWGVASWLSSLKAHWDRGMVGKTPVLMDREGVWRKGKRSLRRGTGDAYLPTSCPGIVTRGKGT